MRIISGAKIKEVVAGLCVKANLVLRGDVLSALKRAWRTEKNKRAKKILGAIIENALIARREKLAICQDTGLPIVFLEIGQNVSVIGNLKQAINKGVEAGYKEGRLRNSIICDPLNRGFPVYSPAVIHSEIVRGSKVKITVLPKGFGCENKSQLKMFNPTAEIAEIKKFIIDTVRSAGPDACPPYIVGVGIGGTADYACLLAKKALLRRIKGDVSIFLPVYHRKIETSPFIPKLEQDILKAINRLKIGPMGLGGKTTALAVNIEKFPTHIAGLPVAVNISCHALRSASKTL